jgi:hypothetical protein
MKNYQIILTSFVSFAIGYFIASGELSKWTYVDSDTGVASFFFAISMLSLMCVDWKSLLKFLNN